jgi:PAS domain S-box-containing protein
MMNTAISETERLYWNIFEAASDGALITDLETGSILAANPAAAEMHGYTREVFSGLRLQRLVHAKSLPFFADYAQVIQRGGLFEILAQHMRRDNSLLSVEWRAVAFKYQGRNCALALLRDVSKRVQAEQQLHQRVGVRAREQSILLEISQTLASTLELQPGLILDQLGVLIKYTHAGLFTLEDSTLVALAVRGTEQLEKSVPFRIRLHGKQTLEALFNGHHPIRIADLWSNEPTAKFLRTLLENDSAALLEGVQSWMWVPLAVKNRIIGGIGIAHADRNFFTPHHADLALSVANQAAITMINAELYGHAQALAVLEERQRLAQNLHDAINQSLFSAGLIAEVLPRLWERDQAEARRSLEDLRRLTRGAQAEMRALLAELRPSTLTDAELGDLLRLLGSAFTGRTNIPVAVTVSGAGSLPAETQVALYRICQEALNNIAKHAKASQVEIDLRHAPTELEMYIRDNGRGFVTSELAPSGHYGLGMMRERAEAAGAVLTITSQRGQGTEVAIHWGKQEGL